MQSLTRLRSERYSSSSGHRLSGPLLQSYHGSPRHSFRAPKKSPSPVIIISKFAVLLIVLVGCYLGGKHWLHKRAVDKDAAFLASLGLVSRQKSGSSTSFWPPSDLSIKLPRPPWNRRDSIDEPDTGNKAAKSARANKWFSDGSTWDKEPARGSLGSFVYNSQRQQDEDQPPPLAPTTWLPTQKQQQPKDAAASDDGAGPAYKTSQASPATAGTNSAEDSIDTEQGATDIDPLHDLQTNSEKEAEQLSALSRVIQQQQDTITKQANALQELQKRFDQQEHQLAAATASASATNGSEGVSVEQYFPEEKVQQELTMLHKVEAQIEAVSRSVDEATKALPKLAREQQMQQVAELERAEQLLNRLSRVAAAINLRTSDPLTESGHDPVVELRHFYGTVANDITLDWQEALSRQSRPSADQLGLTMDPFTDSMGDLDTLDLRLEYVAAMMRGMHDSAPCRLALVTTWSGDLWGLRKELIPWLTYHAYLGVSKLYVLYEGSDVRTLRELYALKPWVKVILASAPLATRREIHLYDIWVNSVPDAHIKEWKSQPGNYHLMTKQGFAVTYALERARADNITWLMHLDPDELLHPGASHSAGVLAGSYSLLPELCNAPQHVPSIRFVNVEGVPEAADITNRYEQVTLFRSHRHLVPPQIQPFRYIFKQGHADAWLHLYTNGKSAVRPDAPGVTQGGPHVFLGPADKRWVTPDNPHGIWRPAISNSTLVLHYAYATPGDVAVKAGRSCPPGVVEAVLAGNTSQASQCFVLDLDQRAFLAAAKDRQAAGLPPVPATPHLDPAADTSSRRSNGPIVVDPATYFGSSTSSGFSNASWPVGKHVQDFFWGELALSEGAPFECLTPDGKSTGWCAMRNVDKLKSLLISSGLMMRLHAPAQTMKGIETAIQQLMLIGHRKPSDKAIPEIVVASPAQAAEAAMAAAAKAAAAAAAAAAGAQQAGGAGAQPGSATSTETVQQPAPTQADMQQQQPQQQQQQQHPQQPQQQQQQQPQQPQQEQQQQPLQPQQQQQQRGNDAGRQAANPSNSAAAPQPAGTDSTDQGRVVSGAPDQVVVSGVPDQVASSQQGTPSLSDRGQGRDLNQQDSRQDPQHAAVPSEPQVASAHGYRREADWGPATRGLAQRPVVQNGGQPMRAWFDRPQPGVMRREAQLQRAEPAAEPTGRAQQQVDSGPREQQQQQQQQQPSAQQEQQQQWQQQPSAQQEQQQQQWQQPAEQPQGQQQQQQQQQQRERGWQEAEGQPEHVRDRTLLT